MKLKEIFEISNKDLTYGEFEIENICNDSRKASLNSIFIGYSTYTANVLDYVSDAYKNGCRVFVLPSSSKEKYENELKDAYVYYTEDIINSTANICQRFFNYPDKDLKLIGITGTSGKTTTTTVIYETLKKSGNRVGLIGTIEYRINDKIIPATNTTPDIIELYRLLFEMKKEKIEYVVMEVSSHSLALGRIAGLNFDILAFTNFSQDHLDFHKTMEEYLKAKLLIFDYIKQSNKKNKAIIINKDMNVYDQIKLYANEKGVDFITYSLNDKNVDYFIDKIKFDNTGTKFCINDNLIEISMLGRTNVYNFSLAYIILEKLELKNFTHIFKDIKVRGRMELVNNEKGIVVIIDYAHKPDALEKVLITCRELLKEGNKLYCVFGCGGDRDKTKRPIMGEISARLADFTIITSDNPRTEDPLEIIKEIEKGVIKITNNYLIEKDRREAIRIALKTAKKGDIVLIAGKGHEDYQIIGKEKIHFDDKEEVLKFFKENKQINSKEEMNEKNLENFKTSILFSIDKMNEFLKNNKKYDFFECLLDLFNSIYVYKTKKNIETNVRENLLAIIPDMDEESIKIMEEMEKNKRKKERFYNYVDKIDLDKGIKIFNYFKNINL